MRAWIPATVVAVLLAIGVGAAAYFTLGRSTGGLASPTPSVDLHSKDALEGAVRAYYRAEDKAGESGDVTLVKDVTTGPGTPAYENLKQFFVEQATKNRHSVTISDTFTDWEVSIASDRATVNYGIVQFGHDTDATTGKPVETDMKTPKGLYKATLELQGGRWLMYERDVIQ